MTKSMHTLAQWSECELKERLIPFWHALRDDAYGGYCGRVGYNLVKDWRADKGSILSSRILWFFSNVYMLFGDETLLDDARHAYRFLCDHCFDGKNGGVFWSVRYDGTVGDSTKHTYNQGFAIYALCAYYAATRDEQALERAFELCALIENKCRDALGYLESFTADFCPEPNDKLSENGVIAHRTMNTTLHVLEAYTELYRVGRREQTAGLLRSLLDIIADKIYDPQKMRLNVFFNEEMGPIIDLESYGHDIEAAWLIDRACLVLDDPVYSEKLAPVTAALERKTLSRALERSMLINESINGEADRTGIWWVQAEGVVGFVNAYQKAQENAQYLEAAYDLWAHICESQIDRRPGSEWLWAVDENAVPNEEQPMVNEWKCPYHNGRMCIELIRRDDHAS